MDTENANPLIVDEEEELEEMSSAGSGAVVGSAQTTTEDELVERQLRKYIRNKIKISLTEHKRRVLNEEKQLRTVIRQLIKEADVSDMHPHRSTGINTLEDLLKKVVPTLRTDYKRLTTDKSQRDSFRAHMLKAIKDSLLPSLVNDRYGQPMGDNTMLMDEPGSVEKQEIEDLPMSEELSLLDELDVDIDDETAPGDEEKKIPIEDDDVPSEQEAFGISGEDETGRNMAFTSNKKINQYILDAFDGLANPEDKRVFTDYLITNIKLYFDKFEDELQTTVAEPTTPEYEQVKGGTL